MGTPTAQPLYETPGLTAHGTPASRSHDAFVRICLLKLTAYGERYLSQCTRSRCEHEAIDQVRDLVQNWKHMPLRCRPDHSTLRIEGIKRVAIIGAVQRPAAWSRYERGRWRCLATKRSMRRHLYNRNMIPAARKFESRDEQCKHK